MPRHGSTRVAGAVVTTLVLTLVAMLRYPGGTPLDRATHGYSFTHNFLSDLGMTVAYNGQANVLGAACFALGLLILIVGLGGDVFRIIRRSTATPSARFWGWSAAVFAFIACAGFVGVAVTPENRVMTLHIGVTMLAWRAAAASAFLLTVASRFVDPAQPRARVAWTALTIALVAYVVFMTFGPSPDSDSGLFFQVVAQKAIAVVTVALLTYLSLDATARAGRPAPLPSSQ